MSSNGDQGLILLKQRHVKFFHRCLQLLPFSTAFFDTSRVTVLFFALSGLDILNSLDIISDEERIQIIDWIYSMQVPSKYGKIGGGFRGGSSLSSIPVDVDGKRPDIVNDLDCGHIAMTYTALASLVILDDDLSRVDRKGIQNHIKCLQCPDGSFSSTAGGSETDLRFVYCASTICYILQDFSTLNIDAAVKYITKSISFEGALGQGPCQESHGGPTFCAVAALHLMNRLDVLAPSQKEKLIRWLVLRQDIHEGGLKGRPNKPADTCYSFWVGATLKLLDAFEYLDQDSLVQYVLSTQDPITGGLGKYVGVNPDGMHTYLGLSGLSLMDGNASSSLELNAVDPSLNFSKRALKHLHSLHEKWKLDS